MATQNFSKDSLDLAVSRFVGMAVRHNEHWRETKLEPKEIEFLGTLLREAGFKPKAIVRGMLYGHNLDQDGSSMGTFPINPCMPYKVISLDGDEEGDYFATGWLDQMLRLVLDRHSRKDLDPDVVKGLVQQARPLEPIQLTAEGDYLVENSPNPHGLTTNWFVGHTRDNDKFAMAVHQHCHGFVDRHRSTATHDVLVCRQCRLRVYFPREVATYGDLRQALAHLRPRE